MSQVALQLVLVLLLHVLVDQVEIVRLQVDLLLHLQHQLQEPEP